MSNDTSVSQRQSGIELLKIIAMFLIVISHCVQSISNSEKFILNNVNIAQPTTDYKIFIMQFLRYFGTWGNAVFLLCSVWFMVDSNNLKLNKIAHMILNIYALSIIFLLIFIWMGVNLSVKDILKCLFPTTFGNNWYTTCYLLLYAVCPLLNTIISKLNQRQHLAYNSIFFILYFCIGSVKGFFFINDLICFIGIYFIAAYIKKYNLKLISNQKINCCLFLTGIFLLMFLQLVTNFAGFRIDFVGQHMFHFVTNHNPIILIISFSLFNIFRNLKIQSRTVNYISSLLLFVYLIHENILFRQYLRSSLIFDFWELSSKMNIVIFTLICGIILFAAAMLIAVVYNKALQPFVQKIADKILQICLKIYGKFEAFMLKLE